MARMRDWLNAVPSAVIENMLVGKIVRIALFHRFGLRVCGPRKCCFEATMDNFSSHSLSYRVSAGHNRTFAYWTRRRWQTVQMNYRLPFHWWQWANLNYHLFQHMVSDRYRVVCCAARIREKTKKEIWPNTLHTLIDFNFTLSPWQHQECLILHYLLFLMR